MAIAVVAHRSDVLGGAFHLCQCPYCATKSPDPCGVTEDGCTSDFTPLTDAERGTNVALIQ